MVNGQTGSLQKTLPLDVQWTCRNFLVLDPFIVRFEQDRDRDRQQREHQCV